MKPRGTLASGYIVHPIHEFEFNLRAMQFADPSPSLKELLFSERRPSGADYPVSFISPRHFHPIGRSHWAQPCPFWLPGSLLLSLVPDSHVMVLTVPKSLWPEHRRPRPTLLEASRSEGRLWVLSWSLPETVADQCGNRAVRPSSTW